MTMRFCVGTLVHGSSPEIISCRAQKKSESNFRWSNCSATAPVAAPGPAGGAPALQDQMRTEDAFTQFEHKGWERVADKYDSVWSWLTRQFIAHLISDAQVSAGMPVLDVACGSGYVSDAAWKFGAIPMGIAFSQKLVAIAYTLFPEL